MFKFEKKHRAVKKHISSNEKAGITARSMYLFAGGNASKYSRLFLPNSYSFPGGGEAKRPACQWQERPLGRRELSESTETSGGRGSDPPRRLRLRKGEPFFGLQRTVPTQIFYFRFSQPRPPQSFARRRTGGLAKAGENTIE